MARQDKENLESAIDMLQQIAELKAENARIKIQNENLWDIVKRGVGVK